MSLGILKKKSSGESALGGYVEPERSADGGDRTATGPAHLEPKLKLKPKEARNLLIQLRSMLVAGVPMLAALRCLIEHAGSPASEKVLRKITTVVESGHDLSYALDCLPRCFEKYIVHLVHAGEQAGALDESLERAIQLLDNQIRLGSKIKGALAYPGFLLFMTTVMTTGILVFLVPKFENLLMKKPEMLPWSTRLVLGTSQVLRESPQTVGLAALGLAIAVFLALRSKKVRGALFDFISKTPVVGTFIYKAYLSRSVGTLALTLESGVPILTGLDHARQVAHLPRLQEVWTNAAAVVREGHPLHTAFEGADLPPAFVQMVIAGENSGSLDDSLRRAAVFLDRETQAALETFTGLLGPATVVIAGAAVGFIVVSLMTPILTMAKYVA